MSSRIIAAALALACISAQGEQPKPQQGILARCEKDVRDYLQTLQFIHETAGSGISERVAAGYVQEGTVREVQDKQGSCAAAELIRTKTASRRN